MSTPVDSQRPLEGSGRVLSPCLAAELPTADPSNMGWRGTVTDSNAAITAGIGATVAGGGTDVVPVFSDGTNWVIN